MRNFAKILAIGLVGAMSAAGAANAAGGHDMTWGGHYVRDGHHDGRGFGRRDFDDHARFRHDRHFHGRRFFGPSLGLFFDFDNAYPDNAYLDGGHDLGPADVVRVLLRDGYRDVERPRYLAASDEYAVLARAPGGYRVRLIVDARSGGVVDIDRV